MALFMNREDLEAIRPAHVSMRAMWAWRFTHYARITSVIVFCAGLLTTGYFERVFPIVEVVGCLLGVCLFSWFFVVAFVFLRYSLRTMMLGVLLTGALASLIVVLPGDWKMFPVIAATIWVAMLFLLVADHDPLRRHRFKGPPGMPTSGDRDDGAEPRA